MKKSNERKKKKNFEALHEKRNSNNDRAEACLNPIVWSCRLLAGLVRRLLERRYRRRYSVQRERLLHHQRCIVLVDSPLYCVQWETISSFERESMLEGNVHTHVSCRSKTEGPQRRNARHRVTLSVPTTPLPTRMRATRFRSPPQHHGTDKPLEENAATRVVYSLFVVTAPWPSYRCDSSCLRLFCDADPPGCRYPRTTSHCWKVSRGIARGTKAGKFWVFSFCRWRLIGYFLMEGSKGTRIEVIRWNWRGAWVVRYGITVCGRVSTS